MLRKRWSREECLWNTFIRKITFVEKNLDGDRIGLFFFFFIEVMGFLLIVKNYIA